MNSNMMSTSSTVHSTKFPEPVSTTLLLVTTRAHKSIWRINTHFHHASKPDKVMLCLIEVVEKVYSENFIRDSVREETFFR
jgi:hypothetical protein